MNRNVIITGCSTGIGAATAAALKERGWNVAATARKPEDLERLREQGFHVIELDIGDADSTERAAAAALALFEGRVDAVVNNAGFGQSGAIEDLSREALRRQFEVNVVGMQDFTNRFIPGMRERGEGRIVNVSSVLGRVALPFMGIYSASKHAMEAISDAMRIELAGSGVRVILVEPGPIETNFRLNAITTAKESLDFEKGTHAALYRNEMERRKSGKSTSGSFAKPPEAVARAIVKALESRNPKRRYRVTVPTYFAEVMRRVMPQAWVDALMKRELKAKSVS